MNVIDLYKPNKQKLIIALGFFDCVHIGHQKLIETAKGMCESDCQCAVFTFNNNPFNILNKPTKLIFTFEERLQKLNQLNVANIIYTTFNKQFMSTKGVDFYKLLTQFEVLGIVCGFDYTFGCDMLTTDDLRDMCESDGIKFKQVEQIEYQGKKASSTLIRGFLSNADVEYANKCLGNDYFIEGEVINGYKIGNTLGFPTANIAISDDKQLPKIGVYAGYSYVDGIKYNAIINIGSRPTFNDDMTKVETHLIDYNGNLYGKTLVVYITKYLRSIVKFDNKEQLKQQLKKDVSEAK